MSARTVEEEGVLYRRVEYEGRIPGAEGIEFISASKDWSPEYRHTPYVGIVCMVDGAEKWLGIEMSQRAFVGDFLWDFLDQEARIAFLQSSVQLILDLLDQEGMFEGEMEGLL
mgnify:CR=1 FL=1